MNITINPGAATADAVQIDKIVSEIQADMQTLNQAIENTIPEGIQTSWSDELKSNWKSYYTGDIPTAMEEMKASAANLRLAVENALAYSKEQ